MKLFSFHESIELCVIVGEKQIIGQNRGLTVPYVGRNFSSQPQMELWAERRFRLAMHTESSRDSSLQ
jgi:hypothetical protein